MSYLNRDERREVILQAAMRVALEEGFAAMTVRRIASEADVAAGQVHHHFSSAGELKALAFVHLIRTLLDAGHVPAPTTWRERLHAMLGQRRWWLRTLHKIVAGSADFGRPGSAYQERLPSYHADVA
ncbi:TetR family transcriptional regulator [Salmonella bongori]|nr:TetR family transcriptional regulator [Salmonella bongori]